MPGNIKPPWKESPAVLRRKAKLARLRRKGFLPPPGKAAARAMIHDGMQHWVGEIEREVAAQIAKERNS